MHARPVRSIATAALVGLSLLLSVPMSAQSMLGRVVLASGGGFSSGGSNSIAATIGQPIAGSSNQLLAGFWQTGENVTTDIEDEVLDLAIPSEFRLHQNYPNPFNPTTTIQIDLPETSLARLTVYDILGHEVLRLESGSVPAGRHRYTVDASTLPSGVYLYRLETQAFSQSRRMMLLK